MNTYKVSELIVIHLSAGRDSNGNTRSCYVLTHALDGFLDATDVGVVGQGAVVDFLPAQPVDKQLRAELMARITTKIDTSPSTYRHFVSKRMTATVAYRIEL